MESIKLGLMLSTGRLILSMAVPMLVTAGVLTQLSQRPPVGTAFHYLGVEEQAVRFFELYRQSSSRSY